MVDWPYAAEERWWMRMMTLAAREVVADEMVMMVEACLCQSMLHPVGSMHTRYHSHQDTCAQSRGT